MTGWLILLVMIALVLGSLWLSRLRGGHLTAIAAALLFGAAGYAVQGQPGLRGSPARGDDASQVLPLTAARHAFFGDFSPGEGWVRMSEALARTGNTEDAVGILNNAVKRYPGDTQLWVALGNALVDHSRGLSPAAEFAYRRAAELTPDHYAASFFYGVALARSGDRSGAAAVWRDLLTRAPKDVSWRPLVENGVAALDPQGQAAIGS